MAYWPSQREVGDSAHALIEIFPGCWIAPNAYKGLPPANRTLPRASAPRAVEEPNVG